MKKQNAIDVIVADDHFYFRRSLMSLMREYALCFREAANGNELIEQIKLRKPDIVLLDIEMPGMNGNESLTYIKKNYPKVKILVVSTHTDEALVLNYIKRGANGYFPKTETYHSEKFFTAIKKIVDEGRYYDYVSFEAIRYNKREIDFIGQMYEHKSMSEAARNLGISIKGAEGIQKRVYKKTRSNSQLQFMRYIIEKGLRFLGRKK